MSFPLKQSTASQEIVLGHFVDDADAVTAMTGLTIANTDIKLFKHGATTLANKNSGGATHISGGIYYAVLDATDTDTLGALVVFVNVSGALPVRLECVVHPANVFDSLFSTDKLEVDVAQFGGTNLTASGGRPEVNTTHVAGTSQTAGDLKASLNTIDDFIDTEIADIQARLPAALTAGGNMKVDVLAVSGDTTAADNAEAFFDGTGYAGTNNVIPTVTTLTGHTAQTGDSYAIVNSGTHGNAALKTLIDTVDNFVDTEVAAIKTVVDAVKAVTDLLPDAGALSSLATGANLVSEINAVQSDIAALNDVSAAEVNAEVVDAINVDTYAEPGQGAPAATTSLAAKINYLFKAWRNKSEQTASEYTLYADNGTTTDQQASVSDDGTTFTRGEMGTGA